MSLISRLLVLATASLLAACGGPDTHEWSNDEVSMLKSLSLESLPPPPPDPSNAVADNPAAAELGRELFFDPRLSANGGISCATCHQVERHFTDGLPKGQALGTAKRNTPSIVGAMYSPFLYWDGRRDSLWAQALAPLEDENEHGTDRGSVIGVLAADENYRRQYEKLFGPLPDVAGAENTAAINVAFANVGKAIAAFERTLLPTPTRFDAYVAAAIIADAAEMQSLFSADEARGLRLYLGVANCTQCHNGPLLTNHEFHNTGVISFPGDLPDKARLDGVALVRASEFNCQSDYSDDPEQRCDELEFARTGIELLGTQKTPSLRNLKDTAPYMHKGQLATIADVLRHYNEAPDAMVGHNEAKPLSLSGRELRQLELFLDTLDAPASH